MPPWTGLIQRYKDLVEEEDQEFVVAEHVTRKHETQGERLQAAEVHNINVFCTLLVQILLLDREHVVCDSECQGLCV